MYHSNRLPAMLALLLLALAPAVHAMPAGDPSDAHTHAAPTGQSQEALDRDGDSNFQAADREMNHVYAQVLAKYAGDARFIAHFKAAQRAWLAYRDAEVAARYPAADPAAAYGSVYPMCVDDLKTELTMQRIEALQRWRDGTHEGDVCAGSVQINGDAD